MTKNIILLKVLEVDTFEHVERFILPAGCLKQANNERKQISWSDDVKEGNLIKAPPTHLCLFGEWKSMSRRIPAELQMRGRRIIKKFSKSMCAQLKC